MSKPHAHLQIMIEQMESFKKIKLHVKLEEELQNIHSLRLGTDERANGRMGVPTDEHKMCLINQYKISANVYLYLTTATVCKLLC